MEKLLTGVHIEKKYVHAGIITKDATFSKEGICTNLILNQNEDLPTFKNTLFEYKNLRGILFAINKDKMAVDLLNDFPNFTFPVMNVTPDFFNLKKEYNNIVVAENYSLKSLLNYFGFDDDLSIFELNILKKILTNKKELRNLSLACSYGKIDTRKTNILDYEQCIKMGFNEYYEYINNKIDYNDLVVFDKKNAK